MGKIKYKEMMKNHDLEDYLTDQLKEKKDGGRVLKDSTPKETRSAKHGMGTRKKS